MLKKQIKVGCVYYANVSGRMTEVRVDRIVEQVRWGGKACTTYHVTNLRTKRETVFRSAAKFRGDVETAGA